MGALDQRNEAVDVIPCARCSAPIARGDRFCPRCGAEVRLLTPPAPAPQAPAAQAPAAQAPAAQAPAAQAPSQPSPEIVTLGAEPSRPRPATPPSPGLAEKISDRLAVLSAKPRNELAALVLSCLGGALALLSFFLPWAAGNGMAIGTTGSQPRPDAWAIDTPAGWPLLLLTVLAMAAVVSSDWLADLTPGLAPTVGRLTKIVAPLALGSGLLAVALLYLTLPWGCGGGINLLALGACLLIAGAVVALFFPAAPRPEDPAG